jgi:hypothetical protein
MIKDRRYKLVKDQISGGNVKSFQDIFDILPKTVVLKDLRIHNQRFNKLLHDVSLFPLQELYKIADLIEIDAKIIIDLAHIHAHSQYIANRKKKAKKI